MTKENYKQYEKLKKAHPDAVLLFGNGEWYVAYNTDAKACAEILGITLTWEDNESGHNYYTYEGAQACFPYHAIDTYIPKFIRAGRRVALCEEFIDKQLTKKLVKRGVNESV